MKRVFAATILVCLPLSINGIAVNAETEKGYYTSKRGDDVTADWKDKTVIIKSGLEAEMKLHYKASVFGDVAAHDGSAASDVSSLMTAGMDITLEKPKDAEEFTAKLQYTRIDIDSMLNGKRWGLSVSDKDGAENQLWLDGKKRSDKADGLPSPGSLASNLKKPAAFAEIGPDNMATRLSHGATLSASSSVDLPQRLIDPTIFMRLAFPGIAKVECKTGGTVNRNARLSLGTASAEGVDCALSLTLTNVYGTKDEAHCALFDVVATPSNKQVTLNNGLSVAVPAMRGVMLVDAKKGVVVSVTLEADYAGSGLGGTQLSGNVKMTLDLVDPEKDGKSK